MNLYAISRNDIFQNKKPAREYRSKIYVPHTAHFLPLIEIRRLRLHGLRKRRNIKI